MELFCISEKRVILYWTLILTITESICSSVGEVKKKITSLSTSVYCHCPLHECKTLSEIRCHVSVRAPPTDYRKDPLKRKCSSQTLEIIHFYLI